MPFDQPTRNRLNRFVGEARALLTAEFTRQLQHEYGMDPATGDVVALEKLTALDDARRETARILRTTLSHYLMGGQAGDDALRADAATWCMRAADTDIEPRKAARLRSLISALLQRIVREQAFTILNRLCAVRMAEARGFVIEAVGHGYRSRSFLPYQQVAGPALGETGDAYRLFLFSLFDEFALELPVLFDRFSAMGRLFPRPAALLELLELINHADLAPLWAEDETLGWIYQYFNSQEERRQMRAESQAPRNSRELAVRNQFFTPRYVVEFLTDNTLGRIWYEMTQGQTRLAETCRYLVRRLTEVFLRDPPQPLAWAPRAEWVKAAARGDFSALEEGPAIEQLAELSLVIDGYELAERHGYGDCINWADRQIEQYRATGKWPASSLELWLILFRQQRYHARATYEPEASFYDEWRSAYRAFRNSFRQDNLSQEELLRQPVYIPFRPLKDPRTILMLDPGCGSMHFGLYSFDLYEIIYAEAWEIEERFGPDALLRPEHLRPLHETYPDKAAFLRDVPRLIIEHNIHGIDIDLRAVQIAGLSLWLRAQKSWQTQGVKLAERPAIRKSNVVCAEPMPGDKAQLEAFLKTLRDERLESLIRRVLDVPEHQRVRATPTMADALCDLVRVVWEEMKLAGEAGSLLKIEESLATAIQKARDEWEQRLPLFRVETFRLTEEGRPGEKSQVNYVRSVPGEEADFWERAEALVLAALEQYGEQANGDSYARRLFAADAARGFAFIDVCRKRYDVALMNPPFGKASLEAEPYLRRMYSENWKELYAGFIERVWGMLEAVGRIGCITSSQFLYTKQLLGLRRLMLTTNSLNVFVQLGQGVLDDATVDTGISIMSNRSYLSTTNGTSYLDLKDSVTKFDGLLDAAKDSIFASMDLSLFTHIETCPFSFHAPYRLLELWRKGKTLQPDIGIVATGNHTFDDFRFLRLNVEIPVNEIGRRWVRFEKGGEYQPFLSPTNLLLDWKDDGKALRCLNMLLYKTDAQVMQSSKFWGKRGLCYAHVSSIAFGPRILPEGTIFSSESISIFLDDDVDLIPLLGLLASTIVQDLIWVFGRYRKIENRAISNLPITNGAVSKARERIVPLVRKAIALLERLESLDEVSPIFALPDIVRSQNVADPRHSIKMELAQIYDSIDSISSECLIDSVSWNDGEAESRKDLVDQYVFRSASKPTDYTTDHLSYCIGASVGRWNIIGADMWFDQDESPECFAPLPECSPGMLQNGAGLPATPSDVPADYPLRISWPGILVDDPGHSEDIGGRVREALAVIWPATHDAIEQEACEIQGVASLRDYFGNFNRFFDDHLKRYSKSRRQAPIYWPLSTPSGSYTLWVYYHRLNDQMLYTCVVDFVDPKLKQVSEDAARLRQRANRSRDDERELAQLSDLERELKEFRGELLRLAPVWKPNLNDGVQITAAPLWKLFQHRGWQRTLRETWQKLEAGDYNWAHLAMSLWPGRVMPKCTTDRSLAIAHDMEDLFWVEENGRWRALAAPEREIAGQLARQRAWLSDDQRRQLLAALRLLANGSARGVAARQVAQHLAEGAWDDAELALLCWPDRVAEKCLDDAALTNRLRLNLPARRTKSAVKRWVSDLMAAGCPRVVDELLATLESDDAYDHVIAELEAGRRDRAPLALALWPDRVIDRCLENVELAAVHDLRKFFWVEDRDGWRRRREPAVEVAQEIERRK